MTARRAPSVAMPQPAPLPADAGLTLVEMLVVLALLALGAVLTLPVVAGARHATEMKAAAIVLAADLASARASAMQRNAEQIVQIDAAARRYRARGVVPERALPARLAIALTTLRSEVSGAQAGLLRFYPDGSSTGGRVILSDGARQVAVTVDWLTGAARVEALP